METSVLEHNNLHKSVTCLWFTEKWLIWMPKNELKFLLEITRGENPQPTFVKIVNEKRDQSTFTSFYCKDLYVNFEHVLCLFSAQKFCLFSQRDKICMAGHCSLILSEMHILLAFLHVCGQCIRRQCSEHNTIDNRMWPMCACLKHYKCYKTLWQGRFCHIPRFLHFSDNRNQPYKTYEKYDWLWKRQDQLFIN